MAALHHRACGLESAHALQLFVAENSDFLESSRAVLAIKLNITKAACLNQAVSLSAHAVEGEPLGGLQRVEMAVAAHLLARLDQAAHAPLPAAP